jgi:hypothetical protein
MAEFIVFKKGNKVPVQSIERSTMLERAKLFLSKDTEGSANYRHRPVQNKYRPTDVVYRRVQNLTRAMEIGWGVQVHRPDGEYLVIIKTEPFSQVPDLGCHPEIEKAHAFLWDKYGEGKLRSAGRWYCRFVSGTTTVSKHGYYSDNPNWLGAAEDIFGEGTMNNMAGLYEIQEFLVRLCNQGKLDLATVIAGDRIWKKGQGYSKYTGVFHTHVHIDAEGV